MRAGVDVGDLKRWGIGCRRLGGLAERRSGDQGEGDKAREDSLDDNHHFAPPFAAKE
jgi:hypothetical protein